MDEGARRHIRYTRWFLAGLAALAVVVGVSLSGLHCQTAAASSHQTSSLIQVIDASAFNPPAPDTAGIAYIDSSDRLLVSDSEVNEMPLFEGTNVFEIDASGSLFGPFPRSTLSFKASEYRKPSR